MELHNNKGYILNVMLMALILLVNKPVYSVEKVTYYHNDHLGSPVAATDGGGNVVWRESYQPFGTREQHQGDAKNTLWFTGKQEENFLGLSYFGARWYDPELGRFLAADPVGVSPANAHSFNRYAYANNNPYKFVDPDGRLPIFVGVIIWMGGGAVGGGAVNAALQYDQNGTVQWGGIGGVVDAAGDGAILGPLALAGARATAVGSEIRAATALEEMTTPLAPGANKAPDFLVSPNGTVFPVPSGSIGPVPVINPAGYQTGIAFTGGAGGANGQVTTMRIMNPTPPRGKSPGYPNGYIKYENSASPKPQGVDPYSGKTLSNSQSHFPIK